MIPINKVYNLIGEWDKDTWDLGNCGIEIIERLINTHRTKYKFVCFENIIDTIIKKEILKMKNLIL